jgi:murein tripeptide amidase MpaA
VPLLTVGNQESKDVIVISARVHPGETVSSFIAEGFIKELVGDGDVGRVLRDNFLIKIVPMLNPDGVSRGNYRFSGYGCDLNRKWKTCK